MYKSYFFIIKLFYIKTYIKEQYRQRMLSLQTKTKKLETFIELKVKHINIDNFSALVINLSSHV